MPKVYSLRISLKGQVTLPKDLREQLKLRAGDEMLYTPIDGGFLVTPKSTDFNDLAGMLGKPPRGRATLEQIDTAIGDEAGESAVGPLHGNRVDDAA